MTRSEFRKFLDEATRRVQPLRRSKPGISLCFDTPEARHAHNVVRNAKRMLHNVREDAGVPWDAGGLDVSGNTITKHAERIDAALRKAGV